MRGLAPASVLIVEDDPDTRANLRDILELDDYRVDQAATAAEALRRGDWSGYVAILLDRRLPDGTAANLLPRLRRLAPEAAVVIVTGQADVGGAIEALRHGAADYLLKPVDPAELRARLGRIAERRRAEEGLRRAEERFRLLVQNSSDIITMLAADGTILYQSPSTMRLLGHPPADRVGRNIFEDPIAHPEDLAKKRAFVDDALRRPGELVAAEFRLGHADGTWRHFEAVGQNLLVDPSVGAIIANYRDVTERKRAEERALQSERLAAIGQMVAGLAHESRNALQRGQANLELLALEVGDGPRARELIGRQQRALDDLGRLYEEVRSYAAPIRLEPSECDLPSLWRPAWADLEPARALRDVRLHEEAVCPGLRCVADPHRMGQVFRNLLENALAACPDPVEIALRCAPCDVGGRPAVRVAVRDNGPGFGPDQRERLFEPFYTTKTKGTGLGLAIARRVVEAHGGRIEAACTAMGAEFIITLPREVR
jgi:PAS domain S-box-containing protein